MKGLVRKLKDQQYTLIEVRVREATSNDKWGASTAVKQEIAKATHDYQEYPRLFAMLWKRLGDTQHVMHCQKALILVDYLLRNGAARFIEDCKQRARDIGRLKNYRHLDADNKDDAKDARALAKQVHALLMDDARLADERAKAEKLREKISSVSNETVDLTSPAYRPPRTEPAHAEPESTWETMDRPVHASGAGAGGAAAAAAGGEAAKGEVKVAKPKTKRKPRPPPPDGGASAGVGAAAAAGEVDDAGAAAAYAAHVAELEAATPPTARTAAGGGGGGAAAATATTRAGGDDFSASFGFETTAAPAPRRAAEVEDIFSIGGSASASGGVGASPWGEAFPASAPIAATGSGAGRGGAGGATGAAPTTGADPWADPWGAPAPIAAATATPPPAAVTPAKKPEPAAGDIWTLAGGLTDVSNLSGASARRTEPSRHIAAGGPTMGEMRGTAPITVESTFLDPSFLAPSPTPPPRSADPYGLGFSTTPAPRTAPPTMYYPGTTPGYPPPSAAYPPAGAYPPSYGGPSGAYPGSGAGLSSGMGHLSLGVRSSSAPVDPFFPVPAASSPAPSSSSAYASNPFGPPLVSSRTASAPSSHPHDPFMFPPVPAKQAAVASAPATTASASAAFGGLAW